MKKTFKFAAKLGVFVLALALVCVPASMAAETAAQGNPGPGGMSELSTLQISAIAAASLVGAYFIFDAMSNDDANATAQHVPSSD